MSRQNDQHKTYILKLLSRTTKIKAQLNICVNLYFAQPLLVLLAASHSHCNIYLFLFYGQIITAYDQMAVLNKLGISFQIRRSCQVLMTYCCLITYLLELVVNQIVNDIQLLVLYNYLPVIILLFHLNFQYGVVTRNRICVKLAKTFVTNRGKYKNENILVSSLDRNLVILAYYCFAQQIHSNIIQMFCLLV